MIDHQVQGGNCGLRDFSDSVFSLMKSDLYYCSLKALFSQIHTDAIERDKDCSWLGKMLSKAKGGMGTSSE